MAAVVKISMRNDIHLPKETLEAINLGENRMVWVLVRGNEIALIPVDVEPRYSKEALAGLDRLFEKEKKKAVEVKGGIKSALKKFKKK